MLKRLVLAAAPVLMVGCSTLPSHPNSASIETVLSEHAYVVELSQRCDLDPQLEGLANRALTTWINRNEGLVRAAEMSLVDMLRNNRTVRDHDQGALAAMALYEHRSAQAKQKVDSVVAAGPRSCARELNSFATGSRDIAGKDFDTLSTLQLTLPNDIKAQRGAYIDEEGRLYGKSFITVERAAKDAQCSNAKVETVVIDQSVEWYVSSCNDSRWLWTCEWGRCTGTSEFN
ncbi:hypothetical protein [Salinibius halmophilus]|uniref:hypothetical protein n=1 Tax=Salinibius halmophilus TaxID=1853216 RepID=UPI000E661333|nr:hypothetical protein [Salinibius halmophilus]